MKYRWPKLEKDQQALFLYVSGLYDITWTIKSEDTELKKYIWSASYSFPLPGADMSVDPPYRYAPNPLERFSTFYTTMEHHRICALAASHSRKLHIRYSFALSCSLVLYAVMSVSLMLSSVNSRLEQGLILLKPRSRHIWNPNQQCLRASRFVSHLNIYLYGHSLRCSISSLLKFLP